MLSGDRSRGSVVVVCLPKVTRKFFALSTKFPMQSSTAEHIWMLDGLDARFYRIIQAAQRQNPYEMHVAQHPKSIGRPLIVLRMRNLR